MALRCAVCNTTLKKGETCPKCKEREELNSSHKKIRRVDRAGQVETRTEEQNHSSKNKGLIIAGVVVAVIMFAAGIFVVKSNILSGSDLANSGQIAKNDTGKQDNQSLFAGDMEEETEETEEDVQTEENSAELEETIQDYARGSVGYADVKRLLDEIDKDTLSGEDVDKFLELKRQAENDLEEQMADLAAAEDYETLMNKLNEITQYLPKDIKVIEMSEKYESEYISYLEEKSAELLGDGKKEEALELLENAGRLLPNSQSVENLLKEAEEYSANGIHEYQYFIEDCTWEEAYAKCKDMGGYLVHINSQEEFQYLTEEIEKKKMNKIQFFIGATRNLSEKKYYWLDEDRMLIGEPLNDSDAWCSDCWLSGEPSFEGQGIDEDCVEMFYYRSEKRWVWNDVPNDILKAVPSYSNGIGYICEFE